MQDGLVRGREEDAALITTYMATFTLVQLVQKASDLGHMLNQVRLTNPICATDKYDL